MDSNNQADRTKRLITAASMIIGVVLLIFVVLAFFLNSGDVSDDVAIISAGQTEVARVADIAKDHDSASASTKRFSATLSAVATSYTVELKAVTGGDQVDEDLIAKYVDENADTLLESASKVNEFNKTFAQIMKLKLNATLDALTAIQSKFSGDEKVIIDAMVEDYTELSQSLQSI